MGWLNLQTLVFTILPLVLPRLHTLYRSLNTRRPISPPHPLPPRASLALNLLFLSAAIFLFSTLPFFAPTNIYTTTSSAQLHTPTAVLFNRLAALRGGSGPDATVLTTAEQALRAVFERGGREARLLYLKFGPETVVDADQFVVDWKGGDATWVVAAYAMVGVLAVHLCHLVVLGLVTEGAVTGKEGARWRTVAMGLGLAVAVAEVAVMLRWEHGWNIEHAKRGRLVFFFWRVRLVRGLVVAATDAVLGWLVWLGATGRAFVVPASGAERVEMATKGAETLLMKLRALGTMRNVLHRNQVLGGQVVRYWAQEGERMTSVVQDRDVVLAMTSVLEKTNMEQLMREAQQHVDAWVPDIHIEE